MHRPRSSLICWRMETTSIHAIFTSRLNTYGIWYSSPSLRNYCLIWRDAMNLLGPTLDIIYSRDKQVVIQKQPVSPMAPTSLAEIILQDLPCARVLAHNECMWSKRYRTHKNMRSPGRQHAFRQPVDSSLGTNAGYFWLQADSKG